MPPPSVTVEVYCFPRRQLIFSFGRRVLYHLLECIGYIHYIEIHIQSYVLSLYAEILFKINILMEYN